jgi:putative tricarboxylic transport membrane protein
MKMISRRDALRQAVGGISAALIVRAPDAHAGEDDAQFPSRFVTLVVPWGAGGPPDTIARIIASGLSKSIGQPVIISNRPGASSAIASRDVAGATPDGYTLMQVDITFAVAPHMFPNMRVDPLKDFQPVGQTAKSEFVLMVSPALSTPTIADFVKLAKAKQKGIMIGHSGIGTTPYLAAITFMKAAGIDPLLVSYRTIARATNDVISGQISAVFSAASMAAGLAKSGKVQVLGVTGAERIGALPEVPTFKEKGIRMTGFEAGSWYGIVAPAKTPDEIIAKLNAALNKLGEDNEIKGRLASLGAELRLSSPQGFKALIASQYQYWGETLRSANVMPHG